MRGQNFGGFTGNRSDLSSGMALVRTLQPLLRGRLMVGQLALNQHIEVQILAPEPIFFKRQLLLSGTGIQKMVLCVLRVFGLSLVGFREG